MILKVNGLVMAVVGVLALTVAQVAWAGGCGGHKAERASAKASADIVDTAVSAGGFETLVTAVKAAGLAQTLKGDGPFTVFAPSDDAFKKLPQGTVEGLLADPAKLRAVLKYHVVAGKVGSKQVAHLDSAKSLLGQTLALDTKDGVRVGGAKVVQADIWCDNGVIHVIDRVLLPPADLLDVADKAGNFKTLLAAVQAAGLADTLRGAGPYTVFAPTDEAFAKLPAGTLDALLKDTEQLKAILMYHVVPSKVMAKDVVKLKEAVTAEGSKVKIKATAGVKIDNANVVTTDIGAANGVIHVIDRVIIPGAYRGA